MYVFAAENRQNTWFTGEKLTKNTLFIRKNKKVTKYFKSGQNLP